MAINSQPSPAPRTRVAVLGCGTLARAVLLPVLSRIHGVEITAVADPAQAARDATVRFAPGARALADWRDAVASSDVDAVVVALPTAMHAEAAIAVIEAGRHLYLEKPIAATVEEGASVAGLKPRLHTVSRVGFNYRFNPLVAELKRRMRTGAIGAVKEIRTTFSTRAVPDGWRRPESAGGGVLLDLGSHHIDLVRDITDDEIVSVTAKTARGALGSEQVSLGLQLAGGVRVQSIFATGTANEDRIEVTGEHGCLRLDRYRAWTVVERRAIPASRTSALAKLAGEVPAAAAYALAKQRSPWHEPSFELSLRDFLFGCAGHGIQGATLADGLRALEVVEAAQQAALRGTAVALEPRLAQEAAHAG